MQKTVNGEVINYTLHGKNVVHMKRGDDELHFFYDAQNKPAVVVYNGVPYSYVKNLQGDIVAFLDGTGAVVVSYVYDAWGQPISKTGSMASTLGTVQPFRYRGYVYDEETELYYLRSRYYYAANSRFLNADVFCRGNLYVYCINSPLIMIDTDGFAPMVCCFSEMGFGNLIVGITCGGGGGGSSLEVLAGKYTAAITGGYISVGPDPVDKFVDELKEMNVLGKAAHLVINVAGGSITTKLILIGTASPSITIKIACYVGAAIVGFSTEYIGTEVEEDFAPDAKLGGEKDNTNPEDSIKNGVAGTAVAFIPAQKVVPRILRWTLRPLLKRLLKLDENDEE